MFRASGDTRTAAGTNILVNLRHGDRSELRPKADRLRVATVSAGLADHLALRQAMIPKQQLQSPRRCIRVML